jgi:hypothetical protein
MWWLNTYITTSEGAKDIFGHSVCTIKSATYTKMLLTTGNKNLGGMGIKSTLGQGGGSMCHCNKKIRW